MWRRLGWLFLFVVLAACSSPRNQPEPAPAAVATDAPGEQPPETAPIPAAPAVVLPVGPVEAAVGIAEAKELFAAMSVADATDLLRSVAHPGSADELIAGLTVDLERRDEIAPAGLKLRVAVVETMLEASSDTEATVALWTAEFVTGAGSTRVTYNTIRYDLAVHDGQWTLVSQDSTPGPIPTPIQEPSDPSAFEAALVGFSDDIAGGN